MCFIWFFSCTIKPRLLHFSLCLRLQLSLFWYSEEKEVYVEQTRQKNFKKKRGLFGACGKRGWMEYPFCPLSLFCLEWLCFYSKLWKNKIKMEREPNSTVVYYVGMMQVSRSSTKNSSSRLFEKKKTYWRRERGTKHVSTAK